MFEPLTIEAITRACQGLQVSSVTLLPVLISATATILVAIIGGLIARNAQLTSRAQGEAIRRLESALASVRASDLVALEAGHRVRAEVSLSMHEKSWGLLRDLTAALHEAHREISRTLFARAENKAPVDLSVAVAAVSRVEMLAASVPPEVDLAPILKDLNDALFEVHFLGAVKRTASEINSSLVETSKAGKVVIANWNARLWETARESSATREATK